MSYEIKANSYTIHGPVKGAHDLHQSFTVYKDGGPVQASFYAADGDLHAAIVRAQNYCAAENAKKALQAIVTGDAVVFDEDTQGEVEVNMDMDQAQALARHALAQF